MIRVDVDRSEPGCRWRTPRAVRRDLERRGQHVVAMHWVTPSFDAPRRFLPIDAPGAIAWQVRTLFVPSTLRMRLEQLGLLAVLRAPAPLVRTVLELTCPRFSAVATEAPQSDRSPTVVLTSGHDAGSRTVLVPFDRGARAPHEIVKLATVSDPAIENERAHLTELHRELPPRIAAGIPYALPLDGLPEGRATRESAMAGRTLQATVGRYGRTLRRRRRDLQRATDWLCEFDEATRATTPDGTIQPWTEVFRDAMRLLELPAHVLALLDDLDARVRGTTLSRRAVHLHGDAGPWNVYLDRARVGFIDWEVRPDAGWHDHAFGPPLFDVLYLVTYWYFQVSGATTAESERTAILDLFVEPMPASPEVAAARAVIDRSRRRLGLAPSDVPVVLGALWTRQAIDTRARMARVGGEPASGRTRPEE